MQNYSYFPFYPDRNTQSLPALDKLLNTSENLFFASSCLDETRSMVSRVLNPHRVAQVDISEQMEARMHHLALGEISISRLRYGARVKIDCEPIEGCFLIQMPIRGSVNITIGRHELDDSGDVASVLNPLEAPQMQWSHDMDLLIMKVSQNLLERTLLGHLGHRLHEPLRFEHSFAWRSNPAWCGMLSYLMEFAAQHPDLALNKFVLPQIEQLTTSILLATHRHNYSDAVPARRKTILPRHVRRVQDFITAHAHEQISPQQLAMIAGVSLRSLYAGFRDFLGISPMQYLRDLRMQNVREELLNGEANNVAGVALRWGFVHLGRFSTEYKQRYGETPLQTLRRT